MSGVVERRLCVRHTAGPYPGLTQIIGLVKTDKPLPEMLTGVAMSPDGRKAKVMRLRTTDKYALYQEQSE